MILPRRTGSTWSLGGKQFVYDERYDGGGLFFAPFLLRHLQRLGLHFERTIEVCAGLGFLGLSLLENELTENLLLTDINRDVRGLVDYEQYLLTDMLDGVEGPVDLIVGNLPYFPSREAFEKVAKNKDVDPLIFLDEGFHLHDKFFVQSHRILDDGGFLIYFGHESVDLLIPNGFKLYNVVQCWDDRRMIVMRKL